MDIPLVVTNDCHYLTRQDAFAQEILMCIQTGKTLSDENRMRMHTDEMYVKSEAEMLEKFPAFADAIARTDEIAKRCHVEFDFSTRHLPKYPLPEGRKAPPPIWKSSAGNACPIGTTPPGRTCSPAWNTNWTLSGKWASTIISSSSGIM